MRHVVRGLSPAGLTLAGLCFALPFVTVGCDAPGGFGRAAPGATTTYSGADLLAGDEPSVSPPERLRPVEQRREDRVGPRPGTVAGLTLVLAGVVLTVVVAGTERRRRLAVATAAAAVVVLAVDQTLVESAVATRLAEQLTVPMPADRRAADYVHTGMGFLLCVGLLATTAAVNALGWLHLRRRAPVRTTPGE